MAADIEQAHAEAMVYAVAQLRKAMSWSPRAVTWFLENSDAYWRQRYLRSPAVLPTAPGQEPPQRIPSGPTILLSLEDLEQIALAQVAKEANIVASDVKHALLVIDSKASAGHDVR